ncbi:MAG: hypothetical protein ILO53_00710 [Clostridia bacterium]|nr:hypothetical protein [Clostridia bacterium]
MALDKNDILDRLEFICGKWRVDFLVNFFSNDLAHIPATEFKSEDGRDFSAITFEFTEDYNMVMRDESSGKEVPGTWEIVDSYGFDYRYTLNEFLEIPEGAFKENVEKLSVQDGYLCFTLGFLTIAMKKFEDGTVTPEPDIGDIEPSPEDEKLMGIVGEYVPFKCLSMVGDDFGMFTKDEVTAEFEKKVAAGEADPSEIGELLGLFNMKLEITESHKVKQWQALPAGVTEEQIQEALKAGEIEDYCDGFFCMHSQPWKAVNGKYYYDTGETRELFGRPQSSWDELALDEEGCLPFGSGLMLLKKI